MMIDVSLDLDKPGWMAQLNPETLNYELTPLKKSESCQGYGCLYNVENQEYLIALYASDGGLFFCCLGRLVRLDQSNLKCTLKHGFFKSKFRLIVNNKEYIEFAYRRSTFGSEILDDVYDLIRDNNRSGDRIEKLIRVLSETDKEKRLELDYSLNNFKM